MVNSRAYLGSESCWLSCSPEDSLSEGWLKTQAWRETERHMWATSFQHSTTDEPVLQLFSLLLLTPVKLMVICPQRISLFKTSNQQLSSVWNSGSLCSFFMIHPQSCKSISKSDLRGPVGADSLYSTCSYVNHTEVVSDGDWGTKAPAVRWYPGTWKLIHIWLNRKQQSFVCLMDKSSLFTSYQ